MLAENSKCCGCSACIDVCSLNAIKMEADIYGFNMPHVDKEKCVNCGKCATVCPELNDISMNLSIDAYAATSKDSVLSAKSASGGIFVTIAKKVIEDGGIVFGTAFDKEFNAKVIGVESLSELHKLQGSKYVQSDMTSMHKEIKCQVKSGRKVLFCGTPCQVAALRHFLVDSYENLLLIDLVCHGVPNNKMFKEYIAVLENKNKSKVVGYVFRDKTYGQDIIGSVHFENGKRKKEPSYKSSYYSLFLSNSILRSSCYSCKFAKEQRVGDLTICDFWGASGASVEFFESAGKKNAGISGVFVNTQKGNKYIEETSGRFQMHKIESEQIIKYNPNLQRPSIAGKNKQKIFDLYASKDYVAVDKYFRRKNRKKLLAKRIYAISPKFLKKILLKVKGIK